MSLPTGVCRCLIKRQHFTKFLNPPTTSSLRNWTFHGQPTFSRACKYLSTLHTSRKNSNISHQQRISNATWWKLLRYSTASVKSPHHVLGVSRYASRDEIKEAYLAKVKLFHPDSNPGDGVARARFLEVKNVMKIY